MTTTYEYEMVNIPTFNVTMRCCNEECHSRNIKTFSDPVFMADNIERESSNFLYIQARCNDCGTWLMVGIRQYMLDTSMADSPDTEHGTMHFSGTLLDYGGDSKPDDADEIRCEWCSAAFHSDSGLKIHQRTCHMKPDDVKKAEQDEEDRLEREEKLREQAARGDISMREFNAEMDKLTEPKKKVKKKRKKKAKEKLPTLKPAPSAGPSDLDREMAESLVKAKPKKVKKRAKPKPKKKRKPKIEKKRSDHPVCSRCTNRDGEECLVGLAPSPDEIASRCEGFGDEWYECEWCGEEYATVRALRKHKKTCPEKPQEEPQDKKPLFLPSSTEVTQDPADVDKSILYTSGSDTLVSLVHEVQTFAYRKDRISCPRTDYVDDGKGGVKSVTCGYKAKEDEWLSPPMLKEISFGISDQDIMAPMMTAQEEMVVCISECPKCGRLSILHQYIATMLWKDYTDHRLIMQHIISRGLMEGKVKKKEMTEEQFDRRIDLEMERMGVSRSMIDQMAVDKRKTRTMEMPEFSVKCHNSKCKGILTEKNSSPRWMSPKHLVVNCPLCGSQRSIAEELGLDG